MPETWTTFGETVRLRREERGLSQDQLAEKADIHRTHVSLIERGLRCPSLKVAEQIALALGFTLSAMVAEAEHRRKSSSRPKRGPA